MRTYLLALAVVVLFGAPFAEAADLAKVNRTLAKEPVYQTKTPRYCLLVFGPEARFRVWLVQDGDILYVDRNGNGDLTEKDERIEAKSKEKDYRTFEVGDLRDGALAHTGLSVSQSRATPNWIIRSLAFAPDGKTLAAAVGDNSSGFEPGLIVLWDVATARQRAVLTGHKSEVYGVAFSPDGKLLASSGKDSTLRLWDLTRLPAAK